MRDGGRILRQALALGALSLIAAAAVHLPLVKRFVRGEFRQSFLQADEAAAIRLITFEEGEELWRAAGAVFVDARKTEAYEEGHVPAARSLPAATAGEALGRAVGAWPREGVLVVYCEGGDCQSSLILAKRLGAEGFRDVRVMTGGWAEWTGAGLPEEKGERREKSDGPE